MFDLSQLISRLVEETDDFNDLEDKLIRELFEVGKKIIQGVMECLDQRLMKTRSEGLRHLGMREHTVLTRFGEVKVKRRYYRDAEDHTRFLLDEALGWGSGLAVTPALEARALKMCSETSYRCSADNLSFFLSSGVSHNFLHILVKQRGEQAEAELEAQAQELFSSGVLPASEDRRAERLFFEADGCVISLQREEKKKHELKAGISYEGWEKAGKDKWRLLSKRSFLSAGTTEDFMATWSAELAAVYDWREVKEAVWSSDGAAWLARGPDLFAVTVAQLDRFHLARALRRALGFGPEASRLASMASAGQGSLVIEALEGHLARAVDPKKKKRISQAISYLGGNLDRLADWRRALAPRDCDRTLGSMESNVDKLVADRFKKRGMSWSTAGAGHMCKIIELGKNGELADWCIKRRITRDKTEAKVFEELKREVRRDPEQWCRVHVPMLSVKSGDPWVKDILRHISGLAMSA